MRRWTSLRVRRIKARKACITFPSSGSFLTSSVALPNGRHRDQSPLHSPTRNFNFTPLSKAIIIFLRTIIFFFRYSDSLILSNYTVKKNLSQTRETRSPLTLHRAKSDCLPSHAPLLPGIRFSGVPHPLYTWFRNH